MGLRAKRTTPRSQPHTPPPPAPRPHLAHTPPAPRPHPNAPHPHPQLKHTVARQERPSKGKFADLQKKIWKDTEAKTRRSEERIKQQNEDIGEMITRAIEGSDAKKNEGSIFWS